MGTTFTNSVTVADDNTVTEPSWGQLYCSDSNTTVPDKANVRFTLKTNYSVSSNLHGSPLGAYYKSVKVTFHLPHTDGDVYAKLESVVPSYNGAEQSVDDTAHTVTLTWENLYVAPESSLIITPYYSWNTDVGESTPVTAEQPTAEVVYYNGNGGSGLACTLETTGNAAHTVTFTTVSAVNVTVVGNTRQNGELFNSGNDKTYQLGQFHIENNGYENSETVTMTFTYPNPANAARVTAQYIPTPGEGATLSSIQWKTVKNSVGGTITLPEDDGDYYVLNLYGLDGVDPETDSFSEITATITSGLPGKYRGYNSSAGASATNSAVTFGVPVAEASTDSVTAKLTISGGKNGATGESTFTSTIRTDNESARKCP